MIKYTDFINNIKPFSYKRYSSVSSREKLIVYTIKYLKENNIPLSWNYIVIAAFKLFPEKFYFSEEFKIFPHIEMLNRTLLHLRPKERNYATGSSRLNYQLTKFGEEIAKQVEKEINLSTNKFVLPKNKTMDPHKAEPNIEYIKLKNSEAYKKFIQGNFGNMDLWIYYGVTPYSQIDKIKNKVNETRIIAEEKGDKNIINLLNKFSEILK
jgi:hypothetical protein